MHQAEGLWRRAARTCLLAALIIAASGQAMAAKRLALAIGNDAYVNLPQLQKAVNDARSIAAALQDIGFEVLVGTNLSRREMNVRLAELEARIAPGDQVFLFFAGHGVALGGENYLIPSDMPRPAAGGEGLVRGEAFAVSTLVERIQGRGAASSFLVLDACRDNPFAASGVRSIGATRGLTRVDAPQGVFILFSAGIGQTALDRLADNDADPNSVFTRKLIPIMTTPGITHVNLAKRVQREVDALAQTVRHSQQPAYYDQIIGEIVLRPGGDQPAPRVAPPPLAPSPVSEAAQAWSQIADEKNPAYFESFIKRYPDTIYADFARAKLRELQTARLPPTTPPATTERSVTVPETFVLSSAEALLSGDKSRISMFVTWSKTPQGHDFWSREHKRLTSGQPLSPAARQAVESWVNAARKK